MNAPSYNDNHNGNKALIINDCNPASKEIILNEFLSHYRIIKNDETPNSLIYIESAQYDYSDNMAGFF